MKTVCLQVGHWNIETITQEGLRSWRSSAALKKSTGASGERVYHWEEVMPRLRDKLIAAGVQVYVSDATYNQEIYGRDYDLWVSLHYDGGGTGDRCMVSAPNSATRPAYLNAEAQSKSERFAQTWKETYPGIVGVEYREDFVSAGMKDYYAFDYVPYGTPAAIVENFNHTSPNGARLKQDPELVAEANFQAIIKFLGIPEKPPVQKETYRVYYKDVLIQEYEYNPSDKIADLSSQLETSTKERAALLAQVGELKADLEDANNIASQFRTELGNVREERDNYYAQLKQAEADTVSLEAIIKSKNETIKELEGKIEKLESNDPLNAYSGIELIQIGLKKLLNR